MGGLKAVAQSCHARFLSAVVAAEELAVGFQPMAQNADAAMLAVGSDPRGGALDGVKC